ncbi:hypothetical protein AYO22_02845 [Fonsecaea multimorphosa]|nr:hypothetical protein AYO22_02845 [Fonsecaea multimorphosa]
MPLIRLLQYFLLLMQYLQATQSSVQTSNSLGLAVSTAMRIGLHSPQASATFPPLEREMRKRTWFMCIIMDRTLSMTLGRPATIPHNYVRIQYPAPIEPAPAIDKLTEYSMAVFIATMYVLVTENTTSVREKTDLAGFLPPSSKLYQIMWKVIDQQYSQNLGFDTVPSVLDVISPLSSLDNEIRDWDRSLLPEMRTTDSSQLPDLTKSQDPTDPACPLLRFRVILTMRSLNLTILLHRPVLLKYFELSNSSAIDMKELILLNRLGQHSIEVCFRSAQEIIAIVDGLVQDEVSSRHLNAWWFTLYYTFNAALVLAGILLVCQDPTFANADAPSRSSCKEGLERAVSALSRLDPRGNMVIERCRDYLLRLIAAVETLSSEAFKYHDFMVPSLRDTTSSGHTAVFAPPAPGPAVDYSTGALFAQQVEQSGYRDARDGGISGQGFRSGNGVGGVHGSSTDPHLGDLMTGDDLGFLDFHFARNG